MDRKFDRYRRLARVNPIGIEAPQRFQQCAVLVVGCGALGAATASLLVRSGIGHVRLVDRDVVDETNLTDQCLYTEQDAAERRPKAEAAAERLTLVNRYVDVEGRVADFSPENAEALVDGVDLIIDGSDNLETKYLLNDVAVATDTPWIYAGCAGTQGVILAVLPGRTHCLRCIWPEPPPPARVDGCESMGILPTTAFFVAAIQVGEGLKILLDQSGELLNGLTRVDVWTARFRQVPIPEFRLGPGHCPTCGDHEFPYLTGQSTSHTTVLCGRETVLVAAAEAGFDYAGVRSRLAERVPVVGSSDYLRFEADGCQLLVFPSGRTLVHGTDDPLKARALCGRYLT